MSKKKKGKNQKRARIVDYALISKDFARFVSAGRKREIKEDLAILEKDLSENFDRVIDCFIDANSKMINIYVSRLDFFYGRMDELIKVLRKTERSDEEIKNILVNIFANFRLKILRTFSISDRGGDALVEYSNIERERVKTLFDELYAKDNPLKQLEICYVHLYSRQRCIFRGESLKSIIKVIVQEFDELLDESLEEVKLEIDRRLNQIEVIKTDEDNLGEKKRKEDYKHRTYRQLSTMARDKGYELIRCTGDHGIFRNAKGNTVVIPQGRDIGRALQERIVKDMVQ